MYVCKYAYCNAYLYYIRAALGCKYVSMYAPAVIRVAHHCPDNCRLQWFKRVKCQYMHKGVHFCMSALSGYVFKWMCKFGLRREDFGCSL